MRNVASLLGILALPLALACSGSEPVLTPLARDSVVVTTPPPTGSTNTSSPVTMKVLGRGNFKPARTTAELVVRDG